MSPKHKIVVCFWSVGGRGGGVFISILIFLKSPLGGGEGGDNDDDGGMEGDGGVRKTLAKKILSAPFLTSAETKMLVLLPASVERLSVSRMRDFCGSYFLWPLWNWGFRTNMESNTAVTLPFEDLAVTNYFFFNMCAFLCEKPQIFLLITFDQCEVFH